MTEKINLYCHSYSHTYFYAMESILHRQVAVGNGRLSREPNLVKDNLGLGAWSLVLGLQQGEMKSVGHDTDCKANLPSRIA